MPKAQDTFFAVVTKEGLMYSRIHGDIVFMGIFRTKASAYRYAALSRHQQPKVKTRVIEVNVTSVINFH